MNFKPGPKAQHIYSMLDDIGPMTADEIIRMTGYTYPSVMNALTYFRKRKQMRITAYEKQAETVRGTHIPIYAIGEDDDAKMPVPEKRSREYRVRQRRMLTLKEKHAQYGMWMGLI